MTSRSCAVVDRDGRLAPELLDRPHRRRESILEQLAGRALIHCSPPGQADDLSLRRFLPADLFLQRHQPFQETFRAGRTAGDVDVHRDDLIHPLNDVVGLEDPPAGGAGPVGDHPFRLGHLVVDPPQHGRHLPRHRARRRSSDRPGGATAGRPRRRSGRCRRSPETATIISRAQQARPKVTGQMEFFRAQLMTSCNDLGHRAVYSHSRAPFFKTYTYPTRRMSTKNSISPKPKRVRLSAITAQGYRNMISMSKIRKSIATM